MQTSGTDAWPISTRQRLLPLLKVLRVASVVLLLIALARPQLGTGRVQTATDAVAIQLVVDRSGSMRHEMELDGRLMSRLDVVKRVLHEFLLGDGRELSGRPADLIGLVTFARFAETSCPLVRDPTAVAELVKTAQPAMQRFEDGTAIGDGLTLGAARLQTADQELSRRLSTDDAEQVRIKSKVVILLTDGEQNAGEADPLEAARVAAGWGIRVYTIGIGAGAVSYQIVNDPFMGERRIAVASTVDESSLKAVAEATGGAYFRAQDGEALRRIYGEIDRLEKSSVRTLEFTDYAERFGGFAAAGAALLALELALAATVLRRTV